MRFVRPSFWPLCVALFSLLLATGAWAQGTTGTLKGETVDQGDSPMAGVALKLASTVLLGVREVVTGADGTFRFPALPPGNYQLSAEKEGFKTVIRSNLEIRLGATPSVKIVMEIPEVGETVEVIDQRPVVDTETNANSLSLSGDFLSDLPTGRSFQDVLQFLPGVTGGGNPNINGGTDQQNQYYLDGTSTTDPVTGTFSLNFNFDAIQSIEVITSGYDARFNQGLGGTVNIVTKSGGNTFEGDVNAYYETSALQSRGDPYYGYTTPSGREPIDVYASLGGPIVKVRFWFFLSGSFNRVSGRYASLYANGRDLGLFPLVPEIWTSGYFLGKLTAQPVARNKLTFELRADPTMIENIDQSLAILPEAEELWKQGGFSASLQHELQIGGRAVLTTTGQYQYSTIRVTPMLWKECEDRSAIGFCNDPEKQVSQISGWNYGLTHGSSGSFNLDRRHRISVHTDLEISIDRLLGSHTLYLGVDYSPTWTRQDWGYINGQILFKDPVDQDGDGIPNAIPEVSDLASYENVARYVIVNDETDRSDGHAITAYVQDRWVPTRGLAINFGGRFLKSILQNNQLDAVIDTNGVSFGVGVSWDPFRDGKTALKANYAQIVDPGLLSLSSYLNRSKFGYELYNWEADQQKWSEEPSESSSPSANIKHPDFEPLRSHEILVQVIRQIGRDMSAQADFLYRRQTNSWEDDEVNLIWNQAGDDIVGTRDSSTSAVYRLRTPQDAVRQYYSFTLSVKKELSDNFGLVGSYTYSRAYSNTTSGRVDGSGDGSSSTQQIGISGDFDNPTQRYVEDGIASYDRPHVFKLSAKYDNPNTWKVGSDVSIGYALGGVLSFQGGEPYDRLAYNLRERGYSNYIYKRGTQGRLPPSANIDLRGALTVTIKGNQIDFIAQVFNLLNSRDIAYVDQRARNELGKVPEVGGGRGPTFGYPGGRYGGRQFEFGVRFRL